MGEPEDFFGALLFLASAASNFMTGAVLPAGGKYFVGQAMHQDNFDNFDSQHNCWNSANIGPRNDIVGLWRAAARAHDLPFGFSEHLGASFNWFAVNKDSDKTGPYAGIPYDGNDPQSEASPASGGLTARKSQDTKGERRCRSSLVIDPRQRQLSVFTATEGGGAIDAKHGNVLLVPSLIVSLAIVATSYDRLQFTGA